MFNKLKSAKQGKLNQYTTEYENSNLTKANVGNDQKQMFDAVGHDSSRDEEYYHGIHKNATTLKGLEKDDLAEVRRLLESKNSALYEYIGSGTYAAVYRGVDLNSKKVVAIKVIDLTKVNLNYRANFLPSELSVIHRLNHNRIVKTYSMSQIGNKVVLVMEFAARGTLSDLIAAKGSFNESNACMMFKEFFSGVQYMHQQSFAHRDLKLENILITHKMIPKIADFSFALYFDGKTLCTVYCGSFPYFAPELVMNKPYNPILYDIWSLGVCLYIITNDSFPFKFKDETKMLESQLNKTWKFKPKTEKLFSANYKSLVRKMLEPDISARITTIGISRSSWVANEQSNIG